VTGFLRTLRGIFGNRLRLLEESGRTIKTVGRVRFGPRTVVFVNSPELVQEVLIERVAEFRKGPGLRIVSRPLLGDGLLTSEGEQHRQQRKLVAPAFAHQRISKYAAVMERHSRQALSKWSSGSTIDIAREMMRLTLGIVGETLFDTDLLADADSLGQDITDVQRFAILQLRIPFKLPRSKRIEAAKDRLDATIYRLIRDRRASGLDHGDLLSMLLLSTDEETGESLTDTQVRDEAMTLFVAGHETTAQALSWAWYLLAKHPRAMAELRAQGMAYALLVIKEAMRIYPPAYVIARSALHPTTVGGFPIETDEMLVIAPWLLHRDPRFFRQPLEFQPERFRDEAQWHRFAYIPFGGGRRICIGNQFALMEAQIVLSTIASHADFQLASAKEPKPEPLITLRPKGGIPVRVRCSDFLAVNSVTKQGAEV
jgi:cytochrome P450